jgi:hypothetical protein
MSNLIVNIDKIKKQKKKLKKNENKKKSTIVEQIIESEDSTLLDIKVAWSDVDDNEMLAHLTVLERCYIFVFSFKFNFISFSINFNEFCNFSSLVNTKSSKVTSSPIEESLKAR